MQTLDQVMYFITDIMTQTNDDPFMTYFMQFPCIGYITIKQFLLKAISEFHRSKDFLVSDYSKI